MECCTVDACASCQAMREVEIKLSEAEALVERLNREKHRLKSNMNSAHDPLACWLPREVTARIFVLCMPTFPVEDYILNRRRDTPRKFVGILSSVCTGWRDIAQSTPQLWNVLCMLLPASDSLLQGIEAHLSRSGDLPLMIQIERKWDAYRGDHTHPSEYDKIFDALNRHSHRWHTLELHAMLHISSRLEGCTVTGAPRLDTLRMTSVGEGQSSETRFKLLHSPPSPSTVAIQGFHINTVHIDWSAVTRLDVEFLSVDDCVNILRHAPRLERLQNQIPGTNHNDTLDDHERYNITHQNLRTWNLRCSTDPSQIEILFDLLTLPALKSMSLATDRPFHSLKRLIIRSSCHLTHFKLVNTLDGNDDLTSLLWMMPDIVDLRLGVSRCSCTQELFELLGSTTALPHDSDEEINFLPQLEKFCFGPGDEWNPAARPHWPSIPAWFPHARAEPDPRTYRPLSDVHIRVNVKTNSLSELEIYVIERDTIPKLLDVVQEGFNLTITNISGRKREKDFLSYCQEYYDYHDEDFDP